MPLPFVFVTNFAAHLAVDIGSGDSSFQLTSVPDGAPVGRYSFRFGNDQRTSEWLHADYPGSGTTFDNAERGAEGGNPALAWGAETPVSHTLTGDAFESLRNLTAQPTPQNHPELYARSVAARLYLSENFT